MDTRFFSVYNPARGALLSSKVTVADCANQPLMILKVLVSALALDADSGFWLSPLHAMPAVPRLVPFDLLYLDKDQRVVDTAEIHPGVEFPPYRLEVTSALVLPLQTAQSSQTGRGDRLIICLENEIEGSVTSIDTRAPEAVAMDSNFSDGRPLESVPLTDVELSPYGAALDEFGAASSSKAVALDEPIQPALSIANGHLDIAKNVNGTGKSPTVFGDWRADSNGFETSEVMDSDVAPGAEADALTGESTSRTSVRAPIMSVSEAFIERERSEDAVIVNGHGWGVEDLFANWVDAPTLSAAWIARNAELEGDKVSPVVHSRVDAAPLALTQAPEMPSDSELSANTPSEPASVKSSQENGKAVQETAPRREAILRLPPPSGPTVIAIPHPSQSTSFTVAQYGTWQVSTLTAASSVTTAQGTLGERPRAPGTSSSTVSAATNGVQRTEFPKVTDQDSTRRLRSNPELQKENGHALAVPVGREFSPIAFAENSNETVNTPEETANADSLPSMLEPSVTAQEAGGAEQDRLADFKEIAATENVAQNQPAVKRESTSMPQSEVSVTLPLPSIRKDEQKGKLKISIQRVNPNGKSAEQKPSLGSRFKRWLNPATPISSDRRRAHRRYVPGMVAHYYTGGAPKPHEVADISMTGFYLLTEDRWMPDTMIQMTLQKPCAKGERKQSITVLSKIVRRASDGVAAEFVMPESLDPYSRDVQPSQTTDRFSLARFL
ncbi:MAG: PilZ domain-containing protein [Terracidiphilus sp.]